MFSISQIISQNLTKSLIIGAFAVASFSTNSIADEYNGSQMWGTMPGGVAVAGALESASTHSTNAVLAGQVRAAELGLLVATGSGGTIQAIGSQSIVTSTINGNGNSITQNPTQTTSNTGDVSNDGTINFE